LPPTSPPTWCWLPFVTPNTIYSGLYIFNGIDLWPMDFVDEPLNGTKFA
jgi:hypothetical protein